MVKVKLLVTFLYCLLLLIGCNEPLPRPTKKGKDTFGCIIDGKRWIPEGGEFLSSIKPLVAWYDGNILRVEANTANKKNDTSIFLYLEKVSGTGEYPINFTTNVPPFGTSYTNHGIYYHIDNTYLDPITNSYGRFTFYATNAKYPGKVKITRLDTSSKIVSGTFEFTAEDRDNPRQTVKITSGRFDTHWQ